SLRFAVLPDDEDPDTLLRRQGAGAMRAVLGAARSMAEMLFDLLREATGDRGPEQRAALRARIEAAVKQIPDRALAAEYGKAMRDRLYAPRGTHAPLPIAARPEISEDSTRAERGRILVAVLLAHPALLRDVEHAFADIDLPASCDRLRKELLAWAERADTLDSRTLEDHLTISGLLADAGRIREPLPDFAQADAMPRGVEAGWWHIFGLMNFGRLREELIAAQRAAAENLNEDTQRRLVALREALDRVTAEPEEPVA
ncbi:MAG TPA: DNA primase, partial [Acetobacteraceae bacterium]|nr:DNA primase [Acetobacteraceae bacterium]